MNIRKMLTATASACLLSILVGVSVAQAGNGLVTFNWANSNKTLSLTSYQNSNMTGLWQVIMNSNDAGLGVDGNFGNLTRTATINWQNTMGVTANGTVNFATWNATYNAVAGVYAPKRLSATGQVGGYGTAYYSYYGGGSGCSAALGWNPFASQWLFSQRPSQPWALINATIADTITSVPSCS